MSFNILVDRCYLWTIPLFNCRWQRLCGMELILQYEFPCILVQRLPISKGHTQQRFTWNVLYIFLKPTPSKVSLRQGVSILFSIHSILKLLFSKSREFLISTYFLVLILTQWFYIKKRQISKYRPVKLWNFKIVDPTEIYYNSRVPKLKLIVKSFFICHHMRINQKLFLA